MSQRQYIELLLTCEDSTEAGKIATALLDKHLIVCAKQIPVSAQYWWESAQTKADEVMLMMESAEDLFDEIETEVEQLHSYETFVLQALPFSRISKKATGWVEDNLKQKVN